jgi:acyl-CoA synthetase (AMP-forming)/AMP-acid ligase II
MDYSEIAQPWSQGAAQLPKLPIQSNPTFILKHHPKNWELVGIEKETGSGKSKKTTVKYYWLPLIHDHHLAAGVQGVRGQGAHVDGTISKAQAVNEGWILLEPSKYDYIRIYPANRGSFHCNKWTKLENLGGEIVRTFDKSSHDNWRRELVLNGDLPLPHAAMLQRQIVIAERSINRKLSQQHIPQIKKDIDHQSNIITIMRETIKSVKELGIKAYE